MFKTLSYWTLDEALALIRGLQPEAKKYGYHLCLGGGVLNKGESKKDLDLYFLALSGRIPTNPTGLIHWLEELWGGYGIIGADYPAESMYPYKVMFGYSGLRIDVFVLGGEASEETGQVGEGRDIQFGEQSEIAEGVPTIQWDEPESSRQIRSSDTPIQFTAGRNESQPVTQETLRQAYYNGLTAAERRYVGIDRTNAPLPGTHGVIERSTESAFVGGRRGGRGMSREDLTQRGLSWSESMQERCSTCGLHRGRHSTLDGRIRCPILNTRPSEFSDTDVFTAESATAAQASTYTWDMTTNSY